MRVRLRSTELDPANTDGSEREMYLITWRIIVNFKSGFIVCLVFLCFFIEGCGGLGDKRIIAKSRKALARQQKDTEELVKVRGELKRIVERKVYAVRLLENIDRVLGRKYLELGSYNLAEEALLEAEYLKPYSPFIKKDLGECYYFLGLSAIDQDKKKDYFSKSRNYFEKTLELDPGLVEARYGLGLLLFFGFSDVKAAIGEMQKVLEVDKNHVGARFALGRFYYENGELNKSLGEYITLTRILPSSSPKKKKAEENILRINRELGNNE